MTVNLSIEEFVKTEGLLHQNLFEKKSLGDLLGKNLQDLIEQWLTECGVQDSPVVEIQIPKQATIKGRVYIAKGATVEPTAYIVGPTYIGPDAEVRHGAYIRGNCYIGPNSVVGHTTEVKGSIFMDGAKAGHFAYVGDSILGRDVNLGAGTKLANLKLRGNEVKLRDKNGNSIASGLRKLGAIIGDEAQTGCNSVLSPGTILYPKTGVLPCVHYQGTLINGIAK